MCKNSEITVSYVVSADWGQYEDNYEQWTVCAYTDEAMAIEHADAANREAKRIEAAASHLVHAKPDAAALVWDANMKFLYHVTEYSVVAVPVRTALPSAAAAVKHPEITVTLTTSGGNICAVAAQVLTALDDAGVPKCEVLDFFQECLASETYPVAVKTAGKWVNLA